MGIGRSIALAARRRLKGAAESFSARARDGVATGASDSSACLVTGRRTGVDLILRGQATHSTARDGACCSTQQRISTERP
jgi:hypothetical protein